MATVPANHISPEEYLERERKAETRSEYMRGEIFAMAAASIRHGRIVRNLVSSLDSALGNGPCEVFSTDLRLAVNPAGMYTYPDVMVVCGDPITIDNHHDTMMNPVVIVEVLSDSTKNYDRGQKFQYYRMLPSLKEYVTVAQDEVHLERYIRGNAGEWMLTEFEKLEDVLELKSINVALTLSEIYRRIDCRSK